MNHVEQAVFQVLSNRQRVNTKTDLIQFHRYVSKLDANITQKDVLAVFKKLQDEGAGALVYGRGKNSDRFVWGLNLKEVALNKLGKVNDVSKVEKIKRGPKRKPGRPKGFKVVKPQALYTQPAIVIQLPENTRPQDIQSLIELANGLKQK